MYKNHYSDQYLAQMVEFIKTDDGNYWLILSHSNGGTLFDLLRTRVKLECTEARIMFQQIVSGVRLLHKRGLVHKDIKPSSIFLNFRRKESLNLSTKICYEKELTKCEVRLNNLIYVQ